MEAEAALGIAAERWQAGDAGGALTALLEAYRERPHPRIANLIDRASDRVPAEPIAAKTVKARTQLWLERAAVRDPRDVGCLLATPLPGAWKDARVIAEALARFPVDPRIAMAMALVVEKAPWDSWGARAFYRDVLAIVERATDARTLPVLAAALARTHGSSWNQGTRPAIESTRAYLERAIISQLPAPVLEALGTLEAQFADDVIDERGEADLVRAIHADPDDDAVRMVYADWLTERGDPRGEFIALQLARHHGRGTDEALRRERALLAKHRDAWLGPLVRVLDAERSTFERGFLAHARVHFPHYPKELPLEMASPALATVRTVEVAPDVNLVKLTAAVARVPALGRARTWRGFDLATMEVLAAERVWPHVEELDLLTPSRMWLAGPAMHIARAFPGLRRLGVYDLVDAARPFLETLGQLERLTVHTSPALLGAVLRLVEGCHAPLNEVAVAGMDEGPAWLLCMRRDATGRFTRLSGSTVREAARLPDASRLCEALALLPPDDLTELVVDRTTPVTYDHGELRALAAALARFPRLTTVDVPWERLEIAAPRGRSLSIHIGIELSKDDRAGDLARLWRACAEPPLSLTFDACDVNGKGHQSLPAGGELAHAQALYAKKRTRTFVVYGKSAPETCRLYLGDNSQTGITCAFGVEPDFVDRYLDWLERLAGAFRFHGAEVRFDPDPGVGNLDPFDHHPRWLEVLSPYSSIVRFDDLIEVAAGFPWIRTRRLGETLALVLGEAFDRPPPREQLEAFKAALVHRKRPTG